MRALLLAVGVAFAAVPAVPAVPAVSHAPVAATPGHFQMVISPQGDGYTATCSTGCTWHSIGFGCDGDCQIVIDDRGVYINAPRGTDTPTFAFTFHPVTHGWRLESLTGTGWHSLGWNCGTLGALLGCSAEVNETGVHGPAI